MFQQGVNSDGEILRDFYVQHSPVDLYCPPEEGMTRQEFADECNINVLMAQYERTGVISHVNQRQPMFVDVSDVPDLARAIAIVEEGEKSFMTLPASVRREFDNDPVKFLEFCQDPASLSKLREWGLAPPEKVVEPSLEAPAALPSVS